MELFDLEIPIRSTGAGAVQAEWRQLEQAATGTTARAEQAVTRMAGTVQRSLSRATVPLEAIRQRTDLLTEGLRRASTASASLARLEAAERQLAVALQRGNLSLEQRIRLEREHLRVQQALATQTTATRTVTATPVPTTIGGRLGGLSGGVRTALTGFAGGLAGGLAVGFATGLISKVSSAIGGMGEAADDLETALRKLNATSRLTGIDIGELRAQALGARDAFALAEGQAVDLTAASVRLTQRAGDTSKAGALMTAWLDLAAANGQSADEALQGLNTTLIGQDEGLNRLGLANPQQLYEQWAKAAGTTAARMTDTEKATAIVNAVIQMGSRVTGEYAKSLDSAAGAQQRMRQEARALQASLGGLFSVARRENSELVSEHLREARVAIDFLTEAAEFWGGALKTAIQDAVLLAKGMPNFRNVTSGSSSSADDRLPDIEVSQSAQEIDARVSLLTRAIELGTADNAAREDAIRIMRSAREVSKDLTFTTEQRTRAEEVAVTIEKALAGAIKGSAGASTDAAHAARQHTSALLALGELEGPQAARWAELTQRQALLTAQLESGTLAVEERVAALKELAAIQAQVDPDLPLDRIQHQRPDIRRAPVRPDPMTMMELPGGEGSIFSRLTAQLMADGVEFEAAVMDVQKRIEAGGAALAATFEAAFIGAFAALGSGGGVGEALAGFTGQMLSAIGEMAVNFGLAAIGIGALMEKIMAALASLNPIVAIAAGAALVALGSALSGAASKSFGGGGGRGVARATVPVGRTVTVPIGSPDGTVAAAATAGTVQPVTVHYIGSRDPAFERWLGTTITRVQKRGV